MTWEAMHVFPGYVALIAAIALVLAMFSAVIYAAVDFIARVITDRY